jgi:hypothetical protein
MQNTEQSGDCKDEHNGFGAKGYKWCTAMLGLFPEEEPQTLVLPKKSQSTPHLFLPWEPSIP